MPTSHRKLRGISALACALVLSCAACKSETAAVRDTAPTAAAPADIDAFRKEWLVLTASNDPKDVQLAPLPTNEQLAQLSAMMRDLNLAAYKLKFTPLYIVPAGSGVSTVAYFSRTGGAKTADVMLHLSLASYLQDKVSEKKRLDFLLTKWLAARIKSDQDIATSPVLKNLVNRISEIPCYRSEDSLDSQLAQSLLIEESRIQRALAFKEALTPVTLKAKYRYTFDCGSSSSETGLPLSFSAVVSPSKIPEVNFYLEETLPPQLIISHLRAVDERYSKAMELAGKVATRGFTGLIMPSIYTQQLGDLDLALARLQSDMDKINGGPRFRTLGLGGSGIYLEHLATNQGDVYSMSLAPQVFSHPKVHLTALTSIGAKLYPVDKDKPALNKIRFSTWKFLSAGAEVLACTPTGNAPCSEVSAGLIAIAPATTLDGVATDYPKDKTFFDTAEAIDLEKRPELMVTLRLKDNKEVVQSVKLTFRQKGAAL